jgi:hypothetical protein
MDQESSFLPLALSIGDFQENHQHGRWTHGMGDGFPNISVNGDGSIQWAWEIDERQTTSDPPRNF